MITLTINELNADNNAILKTEFLNELITEFINGEYLVAFPEVGEEVRVLVDSVTINELGMKTIFEGYHESGIDCLMLTANNFILAYSKGLPSLVGMPSNRTMVSCYYKDIEHFSNKHNKIFNLFTKEDWFNLSLLYNSMSFTPVNLGEIMFYKNIINFSERTTNLYSFKGHPFDYFEESNRGLFHKNYPRLDDKRYLELRDFLLSK